MALDLAFAPSDDANVYIAVYPGDLYRSTDGGQTWELIAQGVTSGIRLQDPDPDMPRPALTALAVDPTDPNRLYAGFFRGGVMISHDGGVTWEVASFGLAPETSVRDLVADAAHPGVVYAATHDSGVFVSVGVAWPQRRDLDTNQRGADHPRRAGSIALGGWQRALPGDGGRRCLPAGYATSVATGANRPIT
jgi:hypothetical protein